MPHAFPPLSYPERGPDKQFTTARDSHSLHSVLSAVLLVLAVVAGALLLYELAALKRE